MHKRKLQCLNVNAHQGQGEFSKILVTLPSSSRQGKYPDNPAHEICLDLRPQHHTEMLCIYSCLSLNIVLVLNISVNF